MDGERENNSLRVFFFNLQFVKALNVIKEGLLCTFCLDLIR